MPQNFFVIAKAKRCPINWFHMQKKSYNTVLWFFTYKSEIAEEIERDGEWTEAYVPF